MAENVLHSWRQPVRQKRARRTGSQPPRGSGTEEPGGTSTIVHGCSTNPEPGLKRTICTAEAAETPTGTNGSSVLCRFRRNQVLLPPGGGAADGSPLLWKTAVRQFFFETPKFDLGRKWMRVVHKDAQLSVSSVTAQTHTALQFVKTLRKRVSSRQREYFQGCSHINGYGRTPPPFQKKEDLYVLLVFFQKVEPFICFCKAALILEENQG